MVLGSYKLTLLFRRYVSLNKPVIKGPNNNNYYYCFISFPGFGLSGHWKNRTIIGKNLIRNMSSSTHNENEQCDNARRNQSWNKNVGIGGGEESYLFAFDFDHTVVNDNSDTYIKKLVGTPLPPEVEEFYDGTNWPEYMNKVFAHLHKEGVKIQDISKFVQKMEATKGMIPLLKSLVQLKTASTSSSATTDDNSTDDLRSTNGSSTSSPRVNLLVISDANDMFISDYMKAQVLPGSSPNLNSSSCPSSPPTTFQYAKFPFDIITNKSSISGPTPSPTPNSNNNDAINSAALSISPYELQSSCKICPKNLCKGSAILKYIEANGPFTRVFYTGDGGNDICPALKLNQRDLVFVRKNYRMHKKLQKSSNSLGITAKIVIWEDAELIQSTINEYLPDTDI